MTRRVVAQRALLAVAGVLGIAGCANDAGRARDREPRVAVERSALAESDASAELANDAAQELAGDASTDDAAEPPEQPARDSLAHYARACDAAIGVTVPDFDCEDGTLVPVTHLSDDGSHCDRPNRLNGECDPGSRFQVLTRTDSAYVLAHCRKERQPDGRYGDIAIIQHNTKNGSTCFYQSLANHQPDEYLEGRVRAPGQGLQTYPWMSPEEIANSSFPCAKCHDNGPVIRSPYLTQLTGADMLPGAGDVTFNRDAPYRFVGDHFASWIAYKVEIQGNLCTMCHRLAVSNLSDNAGTALVLGVLATAPSGVEPSKNPHSEDSPIWMTPGMIRFSWPNAQAARAIRRCARRKNEVPLPSSAQCRITQLTSPPDNAGY